MITLLHKKIFYLLESLDSWDDRLKVNNMLGTLLLSFDGGLGSIGDSQHQIYSGGFCL